MLTQHGACTWIREFKPGRIRKYDKHLLYSFKTKNNNLQAFILIPCQQNNHHEFNTNGNTHIETNQRNIPKTRAVNLKGIWPRRAPKAQAIHAAGGLGAFFFGGGGRGI